MPSRRDPTEGGTGPPAEVTEKEKRRAFMDKREEGVGVVEGVGDAGSPEARGVMEGVGVPVGETRGKGLEEG